ncbi:MAG: hypothetical protein KAI17_12885 [Thiotrichaceae bacterium]|nr:hypothetical protein [Thiotrichaceae bacterium]
MTETVTEGKKRGSYAPLWILMALSALPYIAGTLYYQYRDDIPHGESLNYGALIEPARELKGVTLSMEDGTTREISEYQQKWLMLYILDGECTEDCLKNLYYMRQVRKAMANDRFRINRIMIVENQDFNSGLYKKIKENYPAMDIAGVKGSSKESLYSTIGQDSGNIYRKIMLIDPFGNYMMEYTQQPDPEKILKDIQRLLSVSRIG